MKSYSSLEEIDLDKIESEIQMNMIEYHQHLLSLI